MIRRLHRWLGLAFTAGFVANLVALGFEEAPVWLGFLALGPLLLLIATGLALLVRGGPVLGFTRRLHRRTSIVFLLGFLANLGAQALEEPPLWIGLFALVPLLVLLVTGLALIVRPGRPAVG